MIIAGVDEAGRGSCLGNMVLGIALIEKKKEEKLVELGVKDSKLLPPKTREKFYKKLPKLLKEFNSMHVTAKEIDTLRTRKSLNEIEAMGIADLLNNLKHRPDVLFVDSPDPIQGNFGERIRKYLSFDVVIRSEHKADLNYPIVAAASIIAKVERDASVKKLEKKFGKLGSGYPHDEATIKFINDYLNKNNRLPEIARKSWETNKNILDAKYQTKLFGGK